MTWTIIPSLIRQAHSHNITRNKTIEFTQFSIATTVGTAVAWGIFKIAKLDKGQITWKMAAVVGVALPILLKGVELGIRKILTSENSTVFSWASFKLVNIALFREFTKRGIDSKVTWAFCATTVAIDLLVHICILKIVAPYLKRSAAAHKFEVFVGNQLISENPMLEATQLKADITGALQNDELNTIYVQRSYTSNKLEVVYYPSEDICQFALTKIDLLRNHVPQWVTNIQTQLDKTTDFSALTNYFYSEEQNNLTLINHLYTLDFCTNIDSLNGDVKIQAQTAIKKYALAYVDSLIQQLNENSHISDEASRTEKIAQLRQEVIKLHPDNGGDSLETYKEPISLINILTSIVKTDDENEIATNFMKKVYLPLDIPVDLAMEMFFNLKELEWKQLKEFVSTIAQKLSAKLYVATIVTENDYSDDEEDGEEKDYTPKFKTFLLKSPSYDKQGITEAILDTSTLKIEEGSESELQYVEVPLYILMEAIYNKLEKSDLKKDSILRTNLATIQKRLESDGATSSVDESPYLEAWNVENQSELDRPRDASGMIEKIISVIEVNDLYET